MSLLWFDFPTRRWRWRRTESQTHKEVCSVADALAVVGDRYSLLIVREIGYGYGAFEELAGFTGAPRDVPTCAAPARGARRGRAPALPERLSATSTTSPRRARSFDRSCSP